MNTDTQRFNWFFGKSDKIPFLVQYCKGIAENWSADRWRAEIDLAISAEPNYNIPPWHLSRTVPGCRCDGCHSLQNPAPIKEKQ